MEGSVSQNLVLGPIFNFINVEVYILENTEMLPMPFFGIK